ncbi:MAG: sugar ABC transporter permease [Treponema sp.]|nr:sugar ABC transporter permease [Treponema sp.]
MSTINKSKEQSFSSELVTVIKNNTRQYTMIAALLLIWVIFSVLTRGIFLTARNLSNLSMQMVTIATMTSGMVLVMVAGNIDLSVGSVCGTLGAFVAWLMFKQGINPVIAIAITLALGFAVGCWHGFWIAYRRVPAFIVTLASMTAFKGFTLMITRGDTIVGTNDGFRQIGQGYIPQVFLGEDGMHVTTIILVIIAAIIYLAANFRSRKNRIQNGFTVLRPSLEAVKIVIILGAILGTGFVLGSYRGIPYAILLLMVVAGIFTIITNRTPFGRHVYAIGGNVEAARLSGIDVRKTLMGICMLMGTMTAVGAIVFTSRINAATVASGSGFELEVIAGCIIGGTSPAGGIGTIFGAIIGALVMASLDNGMSLMNMHILVQYMVKGFILLLAVWIDIANRKK